jgi:hypothetical protein
MLISVENGHIVVDDGVKVVIATDKRAAEILAEYFIKNPPKHIVCSSSVDFPEDDGVPADIDVAKIIDDAIDLASQSQMRYTRLFRNHCEDENLGGKTRRMHVNLAAITRMTYAVTVDVPEDMDDDDALRWFVDNVDGGDYEQDNDYWENGHCYIERDIKEVVQEIKDEVNVIKNDYDYGECPDCGEDIPDCMVSGEECANCGHVFYSIEELVQTIKDELSPANPRPIRKRKRGKRSKK